MAIETRTGFACRLEVAAAMSSRRHPVNWLNFGRARFARSGGTYRSGKGPARKMVSFDVHIDAHSFFNPSGPRLAVGLRGTDGLGTRSPVPDLYQDFRFWGGGAHAIGWCLSFDQDNYIDGHPYFSYSDKVGTTTCGGHGLYDDQNSDIAFRNVGHPVGVIYLRKTPWISTIRAVAPNVEELGLWATYCLIIFPGGVWLAVRRARSRERIIGVS